MLGSAIPDIFVMKVAVDGFAEMGLPKHLMPFLGVAKLLGLITVLTPSFSKIIEWAYAGLIFDLIGALYLLMYITTVDKWIGVVIPVIFGFLFYAWYHKKLKQNQRPI